MRDQHDSGNTAMKTITVNGGKHLFDVEKTVGEIREEYTDATPDDTAVVVLEDRIKVVGDHVKVGEIPGTFRISFEPRSKFLGGDTEEIIRWQNRVIAEAVWEIGSLRIGDDLLVRNREHGLGDRKVVCLHKPRTIDDDTKLVCQGTVAEVGENGPLVAVDDLIDKIHQ